MVRVGLAPCSPFSVSTDLMKNAAELAREKGVMLHTHLAENDEDIAYSMENFGCRPGQYAEDLGWVGDHVWHAHCVICAMSTLLTRWGKLQLKFWIAQHACNL